MAVQCEIGFGAGQMVQLHAEEGQIDALTKALESGEHTWVNLNDRDGALYRVGTAQVVYVRTDTVSRGIGFGA